MGFSIKPLSNIAAMLRRFRRSFRPAFGGFRPRAFCAGMLRRHVAQLCYRLCCGYVAAMLLLLLLPPPPPLLLLLRLRPRLQLKLQLQLLLLLQ